MSLHVFSPLTTTECAEAVEKVVQAARVEAFRNHIFITLGHYQMRLVLEEQSEWDKPKGFKSKVSFYSTQPGENERALEDTMWEVPELQQIIRSAIHALQSGRVYFADGSVWNESKSIATK